MASNHVNDERQARQTSFYLVRRAEALLGALRFFDAPQHGPRRLLQFLAQSDFWEWELDNLIYSFTNLAERQETWRSTRSAVIKLGQLGIAMDMSIQLKTESGAICTLSLSFNNDGPLGTFFRYICDNGTYIARYDDLVNGKEEKIDVSRVDVSMNGIELQDREFVAAIREGREPNASVAQVLPCYQVLHDLERQLA